MDLAQSWSGAMGAQNLQSDLVASVNVHMQLHLLDAFEELTRSAQEATSATLEGQFVHQEALLLQHAGCEPATLAPQSGQRCVVCGREGSNLTEKSQTLVRRMANRLARSRRALFLPPHFCGEQCEHLRLDRVSSGFLPSLRQAV